MGPQLGRKTPERLREQSAGIRTAACPFHLARLDEHKIDTNLILTPLYFEELGLASIQLFKTNISQAMVSQELLLSSNDRRVLQELYESKPVEGGFEALARMLAFGWKAYLNYINTEGEPLNPDTLSELLRSNHTMGKCIMPLALMTDEENNPIEILYNLRKSSFESAYKSTYLPPMFLVKKMKLGNL